MAEQEVRRRRGAVRRLAVSAGVVLVLVAAVVVAALLTDVDDGPGGSGDEGRTTSDEVMPGLLAVDGGAPLPDPAVLERTLGPLASSPAVGRLSGSVIDDETGQVLWERDADAPRIPASTTKLLTAVAALSRLDPSARVDTVLARGTDEETLVVVPGGDPTMSGTDRAGPLFPGAGTIAEAAGVVRTSDLRPSRIVVDPGPYTGPALGPGWAPAEIPAGNIAPMRAWMLDAGRLDPADPYSPRSAEPALAAGRALARELGVDPERVRVATESVETGEELGRVSSAELTERVRSMLVYSDNVLAEAICREIALERNPDQQVGFAAGTTAVLDTLTEEGLDMSGVQLDDCSGMSAGNRISAAVLTDVLRSATAPDASREMRDLLDTLPIAAGSGTLVDRFDGAAEAGAGWVRAKTGTLRGISALAGTVTDVDGRSMSFALLASGTPPEQARPVLDRIAAELRACGCR